MAIFKLGVLCPSSNFERYFCEIPISEDNKDIIIGKIKECVKEQKYESVAADEKYIDSQGKSQPSSGTGGGTMAVKKNNTNVESGSIKSVPSAR